MFEDLNPAILKALEEMKFVEPTEVQSRTIPLVLSGKDVLVTAQTGTGKTAAYVLPILEKMLAALDADEPVPRALVLVPTRELADQVGAMLKDIMQFVKRLRYSIIIGGSPYPKQFRELAMMPAFVIGTPGRLIDHLETSTLKLDDFAFLVLDESDRMLDMGFAPQIEQIVKRFPPVRQTMMFSATLPNEVKSMVARYLHTPSRIAVGTENKPVAAIKQDLINVDESSKEERMLHEIDGLAGTIIVFTKTRLRADLVAMSLSDAGHEAAALHGEMTQRERRRVTEAFREGNLRILVATDIAARGLDIDHIRHVINFDLPMLPEDYIHRIGRTGRAGAEGHAITFITPNEKHRWKGIEKLMSSGAGGKRDVYKGTADRSPFARGSRESGTVTARGAAHESAGGEDRGQLGKMPGIYSNAKHSSKHASKQGSAPAAKQGPKPGSKSGPNPNRAGNRVGNRADRRAKPGATSASQGAQRGGKIDRKTRRAQAHAAGGPSRTHTGERPPRTDRSNSDERSKGTPRPLHVGKPRTEKTYGRGAHGPAKERKLFTGTVTPRNPKDAAKALKVREDFQKRVEFAERQRADQLGRRPRFTNESNVRANEVRTPKKTFEDAAKRPHKGAADTRARKSQKRFQKPR